MTEYDFSPQAVDAYFEKQVKISRWVDNTLDHRKELRNPFTPATPAVPHAAALQPTDDSDDESERPRRHTQRKDSKEDYRNRRRDKERDREQDREWVKVERERENVKDRHFTTRRHRSTSVDASAAQRGYKQPPPPPLAIPPYPVYPNYPQQHQYPVKLTSPRDSHHSSRSSNTVFQPSPTYPYSAPVYNPYPTQYPYPLDSKYPYTSTPYYQSRGYSANATQYPYASYETKKPLLKRLFTSFKGNKQQQQQQQPILQPPPHQRRSARRKRSTSF